MEHGEGEIFGRYRLIHLLGQGGMAEVYLGEVTGPGLFRKRVAIKRLLPHYQRNQRFITMMGDEANIAAAIRHPNVAQVLDFGEVDDQHYIAMEYVDGPDLSTALRRLREAGHTLPVPAALYITQCVAAGLHAAHTLRRGGKKQEVIHRDVSPHNILVSYEGAVKLIDFGVAKAENNSTKTKSGVIKGKLQYMSPEQAQAEPLDGRADVFSLGMTLYKLLTGRLPFTGRNEYQIYDQILRKTPAPPRAWVPDLPERIDAIVMRALRKDRERRFQSAADMARVLQLALWDLDADYGSHELAALLEATRPLTDRPKAVDHASDEDEDFASVERSEPSVAKSLALDEEDIDRLTQVSASLNSDPPATLAMRSVQPESVRLEDQNTVQIADDPERPTVAVPVVVSKSSPPKARPPRTLIDTAAVVVEAAGDTHPITTHGTLIDTEAVPDDGRLHDAHTRVRRTTAEPVVALPTPPAEPEAPPRRSWIPLVITLALSAAAALLVFFFVEPTTTTPVGPSARPVVLPTTPADASAPSVAVLGNPPADAGPADASAPPDAAPARPPTTIIKAPPTRIAAPVTQAPKTAAPETAAPKSVATRRPRPRPQKGYVTVNALPWAKVEVDGKRLAKTTPIRRYAVKPGRHVVKLIGPDGTAVTKRVTVRAGREAAVVHKF